MGLFKKKPSVIVQGKKDFFDLDSGRYKKLAKKNIKEEAARERELVLKPHTTAELRGYIENQYHTEELPRDDERYKEAYVKIKSALVFTYAEELIPTKPLKKPDHPPVSDQDPDYKAYNDNEAIREREAMLLSKEEFPMHLHVYNIPLFMGEVPVAWVEVYVESDHEYLSFKVISLEYEEHYMIYDTIADIVNYFSATEQDRKEDNDRYLQLLNYPLRKKGQSFHQKI